MLSGDVDPQPHLAPLPLPPRLHSTPSLTRTRFKKKSTRERGMSPSISTGRGDTSAARGTAVVAKRKGTKDARVWVWGWKARVKIREFAVGSGESVEVRVFLVPAQQLTSNEDEEASMVVLTRLGGDNARDRACRLQDVSPTSTLTASTLPLSRTDSPSTYLT